MDEVGDHGIAGTVVADVEIDECEAGVGQIHLLVIVLEVEDGIVSEQRTEGECILPLAAFEAVVASAAVEEILPVPTVQVVIALATFEVILAMPTVQVVIALATFEVILAASDVQDVIAKV